MLDVVANRGPDAAEQLVGLVHSMFDDLDRSVDPPLLDCSLDIQAAS